MFGLLKKLSNLINSFFHYLYELLVYSVSLFFFWNYCWSCWSYTCVCNKEHTINYPYVPVNKGCVCSSVGPDPCHNLNGSVRKCGPQKPEYAATSAPKRCCVSCEHPVSQCGCKDVEYKKSWTQEEKKFIYNVKPYSYPPF